MKILWIVNTVLNEFSLYLNGNPKNGLWMDALLDELQKSKIEIEIATVGKTKKIISYNGKCARYFLLPDIYPLKYNENKKSNRKIWKQFLESEKPDLIHIWGTEFTHGLCALKESDKIPSLITIQGLMSSISKYYLASMKKNDILFNMSFRDIIKMDNIYQQQKKFYKSSKKEKQMIDIAKNVIVENDWGVANVREVSSQATLYYYPMAINKTFFSEMWDIGNVERHSIICNASGYPLKGLHNILFAINLIKGKYPDIKLYVPGSPVILKKGKTGLLHNSSYDKYIDKLIKRLKLKDNIVWLGTMSQQELAQCYSKTHVFVLGSSIENQSSSQIEAMAVGMPCISSFVGGTMDYIEHKKNGLLYRFEEYEILAKYIDDIFSNDDFANELSHNARESAEKMYLKCDRTKQLEEIYLDIISRK